jgi:NAD(P)-dependent dehydrogenase (short-subunit alcohol dehydrogenase family)
VTGLAAHGARIYMGGRSEQKAMNAIAEIKEKLSSADIRYLYLDLSSLDSVTEATQNLLKYVAVPI